MTGHHLIMGKVADYITGKELDDTHDERHRQGLARLLVEQKGYLKSDIAPAMDLFVRAGKNCAVVKVDFGIALHDKICMILKYGPGSIVTRRRPALAASRLLASYQIPVVVVTNGRTAEILDGGSGKVTATGLDAIPSRTTLLGVSGAHSFEPILKGRAEMESRIVYAYEVDGSCPCDESICRL